MAPGGPGGAWPSGWGESLGPKPTRQAHFFTVVSRDTNDQEFAANRQRFLAEQGYAYRIVDAEAILAQAEARRREGSE